MRHQRTSITPLPSPEDVFTKLNGGKVFSKIDLNDAYLQIPVENESAKLLCINTHRGLYRYERLAFGVKVAPAMFQQVMDTMLGGLVFAIAYLDDIILANINMEQLRPDLRSIQTNTRVWFQKKTNANSSNKKSNTWDTQLIRTTDVQILIEPFAIRDMSAPENTTQLQSFLGLANYYQNFIPKMHELRAPLNQLLKKDKCWEWTSECQSAFEEIKKILTSNLFLTYFNPELDTIVASDASQKRDRCMLAP